MQPDNPFPGWTFSIEEVSAGAYRVRGTDVLGHQVEATGADPDALLKECQRWVERTFGAPPDPTFSPESELD